jgi:hypothetical protein
MMRDIPDRREGEVFYLYSQILCKSQILKSMMKSISRISQKKDTNKVEDSFSKICPYKWKEKEEHLQHLEGESKEL